MQPRSSWFLLPALLALACGGSSNNGGDDAGVVNCASDPRVAAYTPNMTVNSKGGAMKVALVSSTPAPPATHLNDWTLKVTDAGGTPLPSLTLNVGTLMPDHGHASPTTPTITNKGGGTYEIGQLNLFMPGVWHVWFFTPGAPSDTADFFFCVQG